MSDVSPKAVPPTIGNANPWLKFGLIGIAVLYVGVLILFPFIGLCAGAVTAGWQTLSTTFHDPDVMAAVTLSLQVAVIATVVNSVFGVIVAWVLVRTPFPGRRLVDALINLPFALSPVVIGYLLILLFGRLGPLATWESQWNLSIVFDVPGITIATIFITLPLMVREVMPVLKTVETDQEAAAATLGANGWLRFWAIVFPVLRSSMLAGLVLTFARALGEFGAVLVVGGDIQGQTETVPLAIFRALNNRDAGAAYQLAVLLVLVSLLLVVALDRWKRAQHR